MASAIDVKLSASEDHEDDVVEDEIWENQRREGSGGMWLPAEDRGRFSDRFGRFRFTSLAAIPIPKTCRIIEDFHVHSNGIWYYARNFATLESDLAKGATKTELKWMHSVRWRRWVRKRKVLSRDTSIEIMSGWLGSRERRGTWKSRFFMLIGGGSLPHLTLQTNTGEDSEDESSDDEGDEDDPYQLEDKTKDDDEPPGSPMAGNTSTLSAPSVPHLDVNVRGSFEALSSKFGPSSLTEKDPRMTDGDSQQQPPVLFYFRRGFNDQRTMFPMSFDVSEVRNFPKKQVKVLKLSNKSKIDDSMWSYENPGRFAIRLSTAKKRVLNAASAEVRERWVEALRTAVEGGFSDMSVSPSLKRHGRLAAAFRAAKRGQQELRKNFGGLRRLSHSGGNHPSTTQSLSVSMSSPSTLPTPSAPLPPLERLSSAPQSHGTGTQSDFVLSPQSHTFVVDMMRSESGSLRLRLTEAVPGRGLVIAKILEGAKDISGAFPSNLTLGDTIIAVQNESLLGLDKGASLTKLKEVMTRVPRGEKIRLTINSFTSTSSSPPHPRPNKSGSTSSPGESIPVSPRSVTGHHHHHGSTSSHASPEKMISSPPFGFDPTSGEESEREDYNEVAAFKSITARYLANEMKVSSSSSVTSLSGGGDTCGLGVMNQVAGQQLQQQQSGASGCVNPSNNNNNNLVRQPSLTSVSSIKSTSSTRPKKKEAPANHLNITSDIARQTTLTCLERMIQDSPVTYAQLRTEVAKTLQAEREMDTDDWRLFFRDLLDYWICDGIKYSVGGLDLSDLTPIILKVEDKS